MMMLVEKLHVCVGGDVCRQRRGVAVPPNPLKQFLEHVRVLDVSQLELLREEHEVVEERVEMRMQM